MRRGWRMSRLISAAYLERKLRAITGVEQGNPLPDLESLQGLVTLETDRPEWGLAGGETHWAFALTVGAIVGEFGYIGLFNPRDSGVIGIVTSMLWDVSVPGLVLRMLTGANFDTISASLADSSSIYVDSGHSGEGSACRAKSGTDPATLGDTFWTLPFDSSPQPPIVILRPGSAVVATLGVTNTAISLVGMAHRERPLEGGIEIK